MIGLSKQYYTARFPTDYEIAGWNIDAPKPGPWGYLMNDASTLAKLQADWQRKHSETLAAERELLKYHLGQEPSRPDLVRRLQVVEVALRTTPSALAFLPDPNARARYLGHNFDQTALPLRFRFFSCRRTAHTVCDYRTSKETSSDCRHRVRAARSSSPCSRTERRRSLPNRPRFPG